MHFVGPEFFAGLGLKRDHAIARRQIHHAIDHDRRDLLIKLAGAVAVDGLAFAVERVVPGLGELADVGGIDLRQRRVARAGEIAIEHRPVRGLLGTGGQGKKRH